MNRSRASRRGAAAFSSALIAAALVACRAVVGITDLTVEEAGVDAAVDRSTPAPDVAMVEARAPDAGRDAGDAAPETGAVLDCSQPESEAATGTEMCVGGCIDNHLKAAPEFYGAAYDCICKECESACGSYCTKSCQPFAPLPLGICNDCANAAIEGEGGTGQGVCHGEADMTCAAGCKNLSACIASCL
jgi:hypothetical protein